MTDTRTGQNVVDQYEGLSPSAVLGISDQATPGEAKAAYWSLMREWHPDVNPSLEATRMSQIINGAYSSFINATPAPDYSKQDVSGTASQPYTNDTHDEYPQEGKWGIPWSFYDIPEQGDFTVFPFNNYGFGTEFNPFADFDLFNGVETPLLAANNENQIDVKQLQMLIMLMVFASRLIQLSMQSGIFRPAVKTDSYAY